MFSIDDAKEYIDYYSEIEGLEYRYLTGDYCSDTAYQQDFSAFVDDLDARFKSLTSERRQGKIYTEGDARSFLMEFMYHRLLCCHIGFDDPYTATKRQIINKYNELYDKLSNSRFAAWLEGNHNYKSAIKKFDRKKLATLNNLYYGGYKLDENNRCIENSSTDSSAYFDIKLLSPKIKLTEITARSLLIYNDSLNNGLNGYYLSVNKYKTVMALIERLKAEVHDDKLLDDEVGDVVSKLGFRFEMHFGMNLYLSDTLTVSRKHPKASRELFVGCLAREYSRAFFYGGRPFRDDMFLSFTEEDYRRPHADVITSLTAIVDDDITERKIHDVLSRIEKRMKWPLSNEADELRHLLNSEPE